MKTLVAARAPKAEEALVRTPQGGPTRSPAPLHCHCGTGSLSTEGPVGVVTVIPRTTYTFHGSTIGVPPPPTTIPLRTRIDTSEWTSGVLLVRLHAKSFPSATSSAEVEVYNDGYTPEDPAQNFVESLLRGVATIPNGATAGTLYPVDLAQPLAALAQVHLKFYQGSTSSGLSTLTLSVTLVGRKRLKLGESEPSQPTATYHHATSGTGERRLAVELRAPNTSRSEWLAFSLRHEPPSAGPGRRR